MMYPMRSIIFPLFTYSVDFGATHDIRAHLFCFFHSLAHRLDNDETFLDDPGLLYIANTANQPLTRSLVVRVEDRQPSTNGGKMRAVILRMGGQLGYLFIRVPGSWTTRHSVSGKNPGL